MRSTPNGDGIFTVNYSQRVRLGFTRQRSIFFFSPYPFTMRPIIAGLSVPRPPCPSASPTFSSSSGTSGGIPRERDRSPRAPIQATAYPPSLVPMMDARRYRSLFGQRRTVPPSPQREASESSKEDPEERDDTHTSSDISHSIVDVSSVDAS
ncbi:hypothetical protein PIB30_046264 [Stylosanthes scabra]|uniref:Uncharacterized protein n=1 Tax=Stylosanthes scabra TaxID=79078 RepID=A0ABU6XHN6_9FABA|nr:hypothetical protein [Stylosanthes scabra]